MGGGGGGQGGMASPTDMLGSPINNLSFLKTAAFLLYFKLIKYPDKRLATPKSTVLPVALRQVTRLSLLSSVGFQEVYITLTNHHC